MVHVNTFMRKLYSNKNDGVMCGLFASVLYSTVDDADGEDCTFSTHSSNYTPDDTAVVLSMLEDIYFVIQAAKRFYNDHGGYSEVQLNIVFMQCVQAVASYNEGHLLVQLAKCYEEQLAEES